MRVLYVVRSALRIFRRFHIHQFDGWIIMEGGTLHVYLATLEAGMPLRG